MEIHANGFIFLPSEATYQTPLGVSMRGLLSSEYEMV